MSKTMQMRIHILPYYNKNFSKDYPEIAKRLRHVDEAWVEQGPSLFEIVARLDKLMYKLEGDQPFVKILSDQRKPLHKLYETVEENIADWHLAEADQALYKIEDIFDDIERELGKI